MKKQISFIPFIVIFLWSWGIFFLAGITVLSYLTIELDGTITQSKDTLKDFVPTRIIVRTDYVFINENGIDKSYVAVANDGNLPVAMPIGTKIHKNRWNISYEKNGQLVLEFPWKFYSTLLAVASVLAVWSAFKVFAWIKKYLDCEARP